MKRILLLINSKSRHGAESASELEEALRNSNHQLIELNPEEKDMDFNDLIRKRYKELDLVVVGGGDGSINYVLPALIETQLPLAIYPLGTANLLARSLNISADVAELLQNIEQAETVKLDLGEVNSIPFINVSGLGVSTEVNRKLPKQLKKKAGAFSFWILGLKQIGKLKPFSATIQVQNEAPIKIKSWQITVCNGRFYGNWMKISEEASYADHRLHCLSTEVDKWWKTLLMAHNYLTGRFRDNQKVTLVDGNEITIKTQRPRAIDVDGDVKTQTPATFRIRPKALQLIVPDVQNPLLS